jgi:hypothetical protein
MRLQAQARKNAETRLPGGTHLSKGWKRALD